jgi:hypothetical protein
MEAAMNQVPGVVPMTVAPAPHRRRSRLFAVWLAGVLLVLSGLAGCGNAEFDQVRGYRDFLKTTEPELRTMNRVREQLVAADDVDAMLGLFQAGLLPVVQRLHDNVEAQKTPEGKLGEIHGELRTAMDDYTKATNALVDRIKAAKKNGSDGKNVSDEKKLAAELERAILEWGAKDKEFGDRMTQVVSDLNAYLDKLVRS